MSSASPRRADPDHTTLKADPPARDVPQTLTTDQARQGVTGHNVRYVLGIALLGAIVAMAIIAYTMLG
jgi:hypothetical protein